MGYINFKKLLFAAGAFILILSPAEKTAVGEAVFLKDGSIVRGTITADSAGSITIRTKGRELKQLPRSSILRILYTELKLGKIYVQKRDGKGIVAYLVDEDRESYTFRRDLFNPEEFTLKRSEVLFIAEKNPSGLQIEGEPGTDSVSLKWLPPYDPVKKYCLFIKKRQSDKYQPSDSTGGTSATIKNLESNTVYFMIVTAIDSSGNESEPSNELKFKTKNLPPSKPGEITRESKGNNVILRWSESKDPDGKVRGYNIYRIDEKGKGKITTVRKPEYNVPGALVYKLEISAVDDLGVESTRVRVLMPQQLVVSVSPSYSAFTGELGGKFDPGYGCTVNIGLCNYIFRKFEAGINCGYFTFKGKEEENTDSMSLIPFTFYGGYHLRFFDRFSFFPFAKIGGFYSKVKYTNISGLTDKTVTDPAAAIGGSLTAEYSRFVFFAGADYGLLYESEGVKPFYKGFIGIGTYFAL